MGKNRITETVLHNKRTSRDITIHDFKLYRDAVIENMLLRKKTH